ncbi:MAG: amidoligase family protein [Desulfocapsaceae bacterium]|nr:amidoligase family protein [Desulfocapsaceae bacterium]
MPQSYAVPPYRNNEKDKQRTVGFELEFAGLNVEQAAAIVADVYTGTIEKQSEIEIEIKNTDSGSFKVELDWLLGKKIAEHRMGQNLKDDASSDNVLYWLEKLAGQVVPVEIVCPPIKINRLGQLDIMVERLRSAGAKGTDESYIYAFGVHINPEIPDSSPYTIAKYLQAFGLAQEWLVEKHGVDPIRKLTPYINAYPDNYLEMVFNYTKKITIKELIDDYMEYNSTRNRALDMLPLWNHLQPDYLEQYDLSDELTQARPTFHYRLPNCEIEKEDWYLSNTWNFWCVVEYLVAQKERLAELVFQRQKAKKWFLFKDKKQWHSELEKIHRDL